ncbi:helix-turn-helix domain-containing protein [Cohnella rhizosphaerae]|uniref:AraC family transcriptional regulator n=1 Tax=Cohnella rhizosphaerae TaxID=1457232 RepID=A0A9X4QS78_9BACL|nr:AraC family transcriptional regulator [Cohnella rhizosphaerae]MDG0809320.1 AraC family transcriptional regulator [Cohnella rhizosphaerae]
MKPISRPLDKAILKPEEAARKFDLKLYAPSPALADWVEHYWTLAWDLRDDGPFSQQVLSYPSINLTLEKDNGVPRGTFTRTLTGFGECFSVKFRPGGFFPFWRQSAARLTGRRVPLGEMFGEPGETLADLLTAVPAAETRLAAMERWLLELAPVRDASAALAGRIVQDAASDRSLLHVEAMAERHAMSVRTLQRLFGRYIGVSPKWILQRFRLQEAAERMRQEKLQDWAGLSMELGYYDQAHFTRDFKAVVGVPPETYVRGLG